MAAVVDREKDCPFLLRVFTCSGRHNQRKSYTLQSAPQEELTLYTWKNATLEEIAQLISQVNTDAQHPDARLSFRLVYLDSQNARYMTRDLGRVYPAHPTPEQTKTLDEFKFFIGDYLDVAIFIGPPPIPKNRLTGRNETSRFNRPAVGAAGSRRSYGGFNRENNKFGGRSQRRGF